MMSKPQLKPAPSGAGASSASSASSSVPPTWVAGGLDPERTAALRQSIRGMGAQLADLVFQSASPGLLLDWIRVPLECAAAAGNLSGVKRLLAAGVKTETPPKRLDREPLLHLAAEAGNEGVVEELLKAGVDVHEKDGSRDNRTALHCAAAAGSAAAVRALVSAGADVDVLDAYGQTPLHDACIYGHRGVVVFLLLKGACAQKASREKYPALHLAAINNHPGVIEDLLSFGNVSIGRFDAQGRSALHVAAQYRGVEACVALLRGGAAVGRVNSAGHGCLDIAAWSGQTGKLLQVLTAADAADVRKRRCSRALYEAVLANKPHTIRDLVALGADVEYRSAHTAPCLHTTAARGTYRAAEALLLGGANVEARLGGSTPLHIACISSRNHVVQLLLHWGADEKAKDLGNNTARELVGTRVRQGEELLPEEFIRKQLVDDSIRIMLDMAPADRIWRRRGWLVLCRARWLARIAEEKKRFPHPVEFILDDATGAKKRRGKIPGSGLVVRPMDFSLDKGKTRRRNEGGGRRLSAVPSAVPTAATPAVIPAVTPAVVLRTEPCGVLGDGGSARQAAGVAGLDRRNRKTRFVAVVERLLLLREDSLFREVVTFL